MSHDDEPLDPSDFAPEAVTVWEMTEQWAAIQAAKVGAPNVIGVDESGKVPKGAEDWYYREPHTRMTDRHDLPIVVGGVLMFQQRPPIHCKAARPASPKAHRTVPQEISEAKAAARFEEAQSRPESPARRWRERGRG